MVKVNIECHLDKALGVPAYEGLLWLGSLVEDPP